MFFFSKLSAARNDTSEHISRPLAYLRPCIDTEGHSAPSSATPSPVTPTSSLPPFTPYIHEADQISHIGESFVGSLDSYPVETSKMDCSPSLIVLTGSDTESSFSTFSDFPMPPSHSPFNSPTTHAPTLPAFKSVPPLRIVKRNPHSPAAESATAIHSHGPIFVEDVIAELEAISDEQSNEDVRHAFERRDSMSTLPKSPKAVPESVSVFADSHKPTRDVQMVDTFDLVAVATVPGPNLIDLMEANKENIDPNGVVVWPRTSSNGGAKPPNSPFKTRGGNVDTNAPISTHTRPSSQRSQTLRSVSAPLPSKPSKSARKGRKMGSSPSLASLNTSLSSSTKARRRGNVVLENQLYPVQTTAFPMATSYPDFSPINETPLRSQSLSCRSGLFGIGSSPAFADAFTDFVPAIAPSISTESHSGSEWCDVFSIAAYMED